MLPKCREETNIEPSTGKNDGFDCYQESLTSMSNSILLWHCWEKQIFIQFTFSDWWKINNVKGSLTRKADSNFDSF